jgi:hypothetical protein
MLPVDLKKIAAYFSVSRLKTHHSEIYSLEVFRMYKEAGFNTHMLDYHASGRDIVRSFFCLQEGGGVVSPEDEAEEASEVTERWLWMRPVLII